MTDRRDTPAGGPSAVADAEGSGNAKGLRDAEGSGNAKGPGDAEGLGEARRRLAEAQEQVVAALVAGAELPQGFDPERMRVQASSLVAKRRGIVARIRPDAAAAAGPDLPAEFAAYARSRGEPPPNYRTDADDFAAWLRERGRMPDPPPKPRWWSRFLP